MVTLESLQRRGKDIPRLVHRHDHARQRQERVMGVRIGRPEVVIADLIDVEAVGRNSSWAGRARHRTAGYGISGGVPVGLRSLRVDVRQGTHPERITVAQSDEEMNAEQGGNAMGLRRQTLYPLSYRRARGPSVAVGAQDV